VFLPLTGFFGSLGALQAAENGKSKYQPEIDRFAGGFCHCTDPDSDLETSRK
jgi:hypothetical protein